MIKNNTSYPTKKKNPYEYEWDFRPFFNGMIMEMDRHYPKNGDSWKTCDIEWLKTLLDHSMLKWFEEPENVSHLLDIGNFAAMYYVRYDSSPTTVIERDTGFSKAEKSDDFLRD